jgi:hypothetical protein
MSRRTDRHARAALSDPAECRRVLAIVDRGRSQDWRDTHGATTRAARPGTWPGRRVL